VGRIYYLLLPERFDPSMGFVRELGLISIGSGTEPWTFFLTPVGMAIALPLSPLLILSLGEEFGWRAYLLPKLMPLGPRKAVVLVGVIWGVWHWPTILISFNYGLGYWGAPVVGLLLFVSLLIVESAFYAWVTLRSGSVWPATLLHRASNASNELLWPFKTVRKNPLIGPEVQGAIGMLGYVVPAVLICLSRRAPAPAARTQSVERGIAQVGLQPIAQHNAKWSEGLSDHHTTESPLVFCNPGHNPTAELAGSRLTWSSNRSPSACPARVGITCAIEPIPAEP
jgi:membrane protease YdiL (CAAX protease family)